MKKTVNWGIVGTGFVSEWLAKEFPESESCHLYGVAGTSLKKSEDFARKHGIEHAYASEEEMVQDPELDAVYIATPTSVHPGNIKAALNAGKHVLCEKTITMSKAQLQECADMARAKGLILAEALTSIYEPVMSFIKKKVQSGEYGKLQFITVTCGSLKPYDSSNRYFSPKLGGGAIFDIGCYAIGFANYFMSSFPDIVKSEGVLCDTGVDLKSAYVLRNKEDELATVVISLRSKTEKIGIIACEDAFIRIEQFIRAHKATVLFEDGRKEEYEFPIYNFDAEVTALSKDILEGKTEGTDCPLDLSLSILEVMDKGREQWGYKFDFEKEEQA